MIKLISSLTSSILLDLFRFCIAFPVSMLINILLFFFVCLLLFFVVVIVVVVVVIVLNRNLFFCQAQV